MSETAADIQGFLAIYSGAADKDHSWDHIVSKLTTRNMIKARDEFIRDTPKADGSLMDNVSGTKRFILSFCANLLPDDTLEEMSKSTDDYISRASAVLDSLANELENKVDMKISQDQVSSKLLTQTQVQIIHRLCSMTQTVADIARGKIVILQSNSKFMKSVIDACENLSVISGKIVDSREMTAYTNDLKLAQTMYDQAAKRVGAVADRADKIYALAMRRDSAIRMLINQITGTPGWSGDSGNGDPRDTGQSRDIGDIVREQNGDTPVPPGFSLHEGSI